MPPPIGRRPPLFLRLQKPIGPIYPAAITLVAWDDDRPIRKARGLAYIAVRPSTQLRTWGAQLRKLLQADESHKTEVSISALSGEPIRAKNLSKVGKWSRMYFSDDYDDLKSARRACHVEVATTLLAVIVDKLGGVPVGFVSLEVRWVAGLGNRGKPDCPASTTLSAAQDNCRPPPDADLTLEYDQAWLSPAYRNRGWASTAAIAIAFAIRRHVDQLAATTRWPKGGKATAKLTVGADVYSSSGQRFLRSCAQYIEMQFDDYEQKDCRIEIVEMELESRL